MKLANKWNFLSISKERKKIINRKARKDRCKLFALEYLNYKTITTLPIDFDDLYCVFEKFEWIVLDYEEAKILLNNADPLNIKSRNCLARTFHERNSKVFLTVYIKNLQFPNRDYYTIAHELGHIILGHFIEFEETALARGGLTKDDYAILEREAEIFAAEFIMPMPVLKKLEIKTSNDIVDICKVTKASASIRFSEMKQYWIPNYINTIYKNTQMLFNNFIHKKCCLTCDYGFKSNEFKHCPICGGKNFIWGDGKMIYDSIELNEKEKAIICPICENENTNINGKCCQICSTQIKNECTNPKCEETLSGDARYCPFCGAASTFYRDDLLRDWQIVKEEYDFLYLEEKSIESYSSAQNDFDPVSDEMPF